MSQELETFILDYQYVLKSRIYRYTAKAYQDLCGLVQAEKRNIEKICENVVDSEMQSLNHVISESPWKWEPVLTRMGEDTFRLFADRAEKIGLLIEESGWKKAGKQSVGVGRQYLGSLGKVDDGQVAVFASSVQGEQVGIIDTRLYVPESWTTDPKRCQKAGIPSAKRAFRTKPE